MEALNLSAVLQLDKSGYDEGLKDASTNANNFGTVLSNVGTTMVTAGKTLYSIGKAAVAVGTTFYNSASETASYLDHVDKMSQKIGITREAYQEWDYVMQLCGTSVDNLQVGMKTLSNVIVEAANGSDTANEKLAAVGLTIEDLNGLSQEDQMQLVIERLQGMGEGAERTAAATSLLGRSATEFSALLNMSNEDMERAIQDAHNYGMVLSDEAVKAGADFEDSLTKLTKTMGGAKNSAMVEFLPAITSIMDGLSDLVIGSDDAGESIEKGFDGIVQAINKAVPKISTIITKLTNAIIKNAPSIIENLASALVKALPELISTLSRAIPSTILSLLNVILSNLPMLLDAGIKAVVEMAKGLSEGIRSGETIQNITKCVLGLVEVILDNIDLVIDAGIELIMAVSEGLIDSMPILLDKAPEIVQKLAEAIIKNAPKLLMASLELVVKTQLGIIQNFPKVLDTMVACIGELVVTMINEAPNVADSVKEWIARMVSMLTSKWADIKSTFKNLFDNWIPTIKGFYSYFVDVAKEWMTSLIDTIRSKWDELKTKVSGWMVELKNKFISGVDGFVQIGTDVVNGILDGIKSGWETLKTWVQNAWDGIKKIFTISISDIKMPTDSSKTGSTSNAITSFGITDIRPISASFSSNKDDSEQIMLLREQNRILTQILRKDLTVDTDSIFKSMQNKSNIYSRTRGISAFS